PHFGQSHATSARANGRCRLTLWRRLVTDSPGQSPAISRRGNRAMTSQVETATNSEPESEASGPGNGPVNAAQQLVEGAAQHLVEGVNRVLTKPRFRGWIHVYAAGIAVIAGASLVAVSWAVASTR